MKPNSIKELVSLSLNPYSWILREDGQLQLTTRFALKYQYFKGQVQVRLGPTTQYWSIYMPRTKGFTWIKLLDDPLKNDVVAARFLVEPFTDADKAEGLIPPGHPLNDTKNTNSWIESVDSGELVIYEDATVFKKYLFKGKVFKGLWIATREPDSVIFEFKKTKEAPGK